MSEVDAVILWVDGDDPALARKRSLYAGDFEAGRDDLAAPTRFADVGEIHWCVRSINRFAPWIRKIWIVTDGQDPHVESTIPVEVVDHSVIYSGHEDLLPVFNSISIESMIWRIPGLSEKFLYFNDDLVLAAPVSQEDFFTPDGRVVFYGKWALTPWTRLLRDLKPKVDGQRQTTVKHSLLKTVDVASRLAPRLTPGLTPALDSALAPGLTPALDSALAPGLCQACVRSKALRLVFPFPEHVPKALLRSFYIGLDASVPSLLPENASCRFRDLSQFRADALLPMMLVWNGRCVVRSCRQSFFYFKPRPASKGTREGLAYFEKKFARFGGKKSPCFVAAQFGTASLSGCSSAFPLGPESGCDGVKFLCFNSLDQASPEVLSLVRDWVGRRLGL